MMRRRSKITVLVMLALLTTGTSLSMQYQGEWREHADRVMDYADYVIDLINFLNKTYRHGFEAGKKEGARPFVERLNDLYGDGDGKYSGWHDDFSDIWRAIFKFLGDKNPHNFLWEKGYKRLEVDFFPPLLSAFKERSNDLGVKKAKKVFGDTSNDTPENISLEEYLSIQMMCYKENIHAGYKRFIAAREKPKKYNVLKRSLSCNDLSSVFESET